MTDTLSANQAPTISPLEQEVLDEYATLLDNLNKVCFHPSLLLFPNLFLSSSNSVPFCPALPFSPGHNNLLTLSDMISALHLPLNPLRQTNSRDPRRPQTTGEKDEPCVYAFEGECV